MSTIEVDVSPNGVATSKLGKPAEPCPECGKLIAVTYMSTHQRVMHPTVVKQRRSPSMDPRPTDVPCPECGTLYRPKSLRMHLKTQHGYVGGNPRHVMKAAVPAATVAQATRLAEPATPDMVNDIMLAVAMARWPDGIPPSRLNELLEWRAATERLLR